MAKNDQIKKKNTEKNGGLSYIKNQRNYLILNAIIPFYCIIVQFVNLLFTFLFILRVDELLPEFGRPRTPLFLIDGLTPSFLLLVFSIFAITNFIFLMRWRKKVNEYEGQQNEIDPLERNVSLTQLFYEIIDIMETLKKIFIGLNLIFAFYLQWFFRFFLIEFRRVTFQPQSPDLFRSSIMPWLNLSLLLLLLIYLAFNWRHFLKWNRKLSRLKDFEQQVYNELDLEGKGVLLVFGDSEDLEETRSILMQKKELSVKYIQVEDKAGLERKLNKVLKESTKLNDID